jgi:hypothetical protein
MATKKAKVSPKINIGEILDELRDFQNIVAEENAVLGEVSYDILTEPQQHSYDEAEDYLDTLYSDLSNAIQELEELSDLNEIKSRFNKRPKLTYKVSFKIS